MDFRGKVAVVTGAGRGIGRAIAGAFLDAGAAVVLAEIDADLGRRAEEQLAPRGEAVFLPTDVGDEPAVRHMVAQTLARHGRLDVVVNNAGISRNGPVTELPLADWNRVLAVNLTSIMLTAKHAGPHLRSAGGAMVNIASTRAQMSEPNTEAYSASKGGIVALTHALAMSLAPHVRVNCISPGWICTGDYDALRPVDHAQHPAGRVGRPEDTAQMALYLCSDAAGFVTGENVVIDGGMTRKMIYEE